MAEVAHSVAQHLQVVALEYDREIRRLVPHYEEMLAEGVALAAALFPRAARVLDLGGGTGALSQALLAALPGLHAIVLDVDADMLARARVRLAWAGERVSYREQSFTAPLPECEAIVASLALHHVRERAPKTALYAAIRQRLPSGGVFLNLDAAVSADPVLAALTYDRWAQAMGAHGIGESEARRCFAEWAHEDRYFGLDEELAMLSEAGFARPECFWRRGSQAIIGGRAT